MWSNATMAAEKRNGGATVCVSSRGALLSARRSPTAMLSSITRGKQHMHHAREVTGGSDAALTELCHYASSFKTSLSDFIVFLSGSSFKVQSRQLFKSALHTKKNNKDFPMRFSRISTIKWDPLGLTHIGNPWCENSWEFLCLSDQILFSQALKSCLRKLQQISLGYWC